MKHSQAAAIIAGTVADAIRERLITYTPVRDGHQANILAYTRRQAIALAEHCQAEGLDPHPYLSDIAPAIDGATRAADAAGLTIPSLPQE